MQGRFFPTQYSYVVTEACAVLQRQATCSHSPAHRDLFQKQVPNFPRGWAPCTVMDHVLYHVAPLAASFRNSAGLAFFSHLPHRGLSQSLLPWCRPSEIPGACPITTTATVRGGLLSGCQQGAACCLTCCLRWHCGPLNSPGMLES